MVSAILRLFNRDTVSINQTALLLAVFSVLSQLVGLLRDRLLASLIGPSASLDTYYAAFRVPDFVYNSFGLLFSVTVLIPFITDCLRDEENGNKTTLRTFLNSIFTVYVWGMIGISLVLFVLMPLLSHAVAPGFSTLQHSNLVLYSRIMLLSPFFFGLSSLLSSFAQVQKKFVAFAIAPLIYNVGILLGILCLRPLLGMLGVVLGVAIGAALYFLIQVPTLVHLKRIPSFTRSVDWKIIRKVMAMSLPRTLGASLSNITFIIMAALASLLAVGSISVFQFSYNIENTPLMVFGISYAVAAFPTMTRLFAEGQRSEMVKVLYRATRNIFFFTVPIALVMIVLRAHIVRVLLGAGHFSWNDTRLVAASVALFCVSVTAQSMILLLVRGFFATGDTWRPLKINISAVLVSGMSALGLAYAYHHGFFFRHFIDSLLRIEGVEGGSVVLLALGFSIGQTVNALVLWAVLHRKLRVEIGERTILSRTLSHMVAAGIIAAAISYGTLSVMGGSVDHAHFWGVFAEATIACITGFVAYGIVLYALGNEDIVLFIGTIKSKFWKQKPAIVHEQKEL